METLIYHGAGERIDKFLCQHFPYSRSFFHHIISRQGVHIQNLDNKAIKKSYKLKPLDTIVIDDLQRYLGSEVLSEAPNIDIPIIKETDDYLVVHKPKGVLSHPNSIWDANKASIVGFLYHRYKSLPSIGNFVRAGLIHRLDKDTDGLMILVKTERGLSHFKKLFQSKSEAKTLIEKENIPLKKFYHAISILTPIGKDFIKQINTKLPYILEEMVIPKVTPSVPKLGISKIVTIKNLEDGLVRIELEILTGRTHQIRYHLSNHGLAILGDKLYASDTLQNKKNDMQLTAYRIIFEDLDGKIIDLHV